MARHIEASLDARPCARWISFVDLTGARKELREEWPGHDD
jgi:hypothetical protein